MVTENFQDSGVKKVKLSAGEQEVLDKNLREEGVIIDRELQSLLSYVTGLSEKHNKKTSEKDLSFQVLSMIDKVEGAVDLDKFKDRAEKVKKSIDGRPGNSLRHALNTPGGKLPFTRSFGEGSDEEVDEIYNLIGEYLIAKHSV